MTLAQMVPGRERCGAWTLHVRISSMQEPSFALSFTPGESARGTAQRMASKEEARMAESVAPRVQAPALWDMFTADDGERPGCFG